MTYEPFNILTFSSHIDTLRSNLSLTYNGSEIEDGREWHYYSVIDKISHIDIDERIKVKSIRSSPATYYDLIKVDTIVFKISVSDDPNNIRRSEDGIIS